MSIPWAEIIMIVLELIRECPEENEQRIMERIRNTDRGERIRFKRALRERFGRFGYWLRGGDDMLEAVLYQARMAEEDDVLAIVQQSRVQSRV